MTRFVRRLRPDSRGMIRSQPPVVKTGGSVTPYIKKVDTLQRLDRLLAGKKPEICITRKQGGIGDVLMTLPTVKAVAKKYDIQVDYGTDFEYLGGALPKSVQYLPYIRDIVDHRTLNPADYDAVLDLTCPCVAYEKPLVAPINRVDLFAKHLGIHLTDHDIDFILQPEEEAWAHEYLQTNNLGRQDLILVQPSSSTTKRDAPLDLMKKAIAHVVTQRRNTAALIITHTSDNIKAKWNVPNVHILNNLDIRQIGALMPHTRVTVCPDSAILHLAAAQHHPTVTLFGPTDPHARVNHHPEAIAIWPGKELANYPCWYEDPRDGYLCWKRLELDTVTQTIMAVLDDLPLPPSRDFVTFGSKKPEETLYEIL